MSHHFSKLDTSAHLDSNLLPRINQLYSQPHRHLSVLSLSRGYHALLLIVPAMQTILFLVSIPF